jgi:hypothetical protein
MRRSFLVLGLAFAIFVTGIVSQARASSPRSSLSTETYSTSPIVVRRGHNGSGLLVVNRAANFGTYLFLNLKIDGRPIANVPLGRRFEGSLPPGHHVLSALAVPRADFRPPAHIHFVVQPGRSYFFTAVWESDRGITLRGWES